MHRGVVHDPGESPGLILIFPHMEDILKINGMPQKMKKETEETYPDYLEKVYTNIKNVYNDDEGIKSVLPEFNFQNTSRWPRGTLIEIHPEINERDSKQINWLPYDKYDLARGGGSFTDLEQFLYNLYLFRTDKENYIPFFKVELPVDIR